MTANDCTHLDFVISESTNECRSVSQCLRTARTGRHDQRVRHLPASGVENRRVLSAGRPVPHQTRQRQSRTRLSLQSRGAAPLDQTIFGIPTGRRWLEAPKLDATRVGKAASAAADIHRDRQFVDRLLLSR